MKRIIYALAVLPFFFALGCANESAQVAQKLDTSQELNGKQVEVSGKAEFPLVVFENTSAGNKSAITLVVSSAAEHSRITNINVNYGKGTKNGYYVNVPEGTEDFKDSDVVLYDKDGKEISHGRVTIKGTVSYGGEGLKPNEYSINEVTIEAR